jgi:thymidylate synthase ThyX
MEVKVLLDSINPYTGVRLTTLHCVYPQFIHQQVLTHRMFSRNSSSLRAISYQRATDEFETVYPTWTEEKKGMQGNVIVNKKTIQQCNKLVDEMNAAVLKFCNELEKQGIHHQDINNYLRPFQNIHTVITATDWDNFFEQRLHESTKPDMQRLAHLIYNALEDSRPVRRSDHIPLIREDEIYSCHVEDIRLISAARLARISYFKWSDDTNKDLELAKKLIADKHLSPFEHIAFAQESGQYFANFKSWKQLRHQLF